MKDAGEKCLRPSVKHRKSNDGEALKYVICIDEKEFFTSKGIASFYYGAMTKSSALWDTALV